MTLPLEVLSVHLDLHHSTTMSTWTKFHVVAIVFLSTLWAVASGNTTQIAFIQEVIPSVIHTSIISIPFSNTTLKKCKCGADEVLNGSTCRREPTFVTVVDLTNFVMPMNTSAFGRVSVAELQCPDGIPRVILDSSHPLYIKPTGELLWYDELLEDYCVEHILQDDHVLYQISVCLPPPPIPRCCPPGHILSPNNSCITHNLQNFAPKIDFNSDFQQWKSLDGDLKNITCEGISEAHHINLNDMEGKILYDFSEPLLSWKPSAASTTEVLEREYCVGMKLDGENNDPIYVARTCYTDPLVHHKFICTNNTCIRKCCLENQIVYNGLCIGVYSEDEVWQPIFHSSDNQSAEVASEGNLTIINGSPLCSSNSQLNLHPDDKLEFFLMTNGSLHVPVHKTVYPATDYCLDHFLVESGIVRNAVLCDLKDDDTCFWRNILIVVLQGVTCVFLAVTMAVYLGVPDLRDRTNGRCLISMVSAMLISYISIISNIQIEESDTLCIIVAFVGHVSTLATFFWLNVMCYDMWSTLRSTRQQYHSMKRFLLYSAYAWGCPLVVGLVAVIIDRQESSHLIRPKFTENSCWFYGDAEYWLYLQGIVCILVLANLFFFVHVAVTLSRKMKQRQSMFETSTSHSNNSTKTKELAWLYIKLFIVMGVVWFAEIISSVHHRNTCTYWVLTDIINGLQGVFIFLVAVCNKDNMKKIRAAWHPRVKNVQKTVTNLRGKTTTHSQDKRTTDLTVVTSDASRKTSVTSIPRKISLVSNILFPNSNRSRGATQLSDTPEPSRKFSNTTPPRKISTVSNLEVIPMTTMDE